MNTYRAFYDHKQITVRAGNSHAAKQKAVVLFGAPRARQHEVIVRITTQRAHGALFHVGRL